MESLGDKFDAAIAEVHELRAKRREKVEREEREAHDKREAAAALAREVLYPALQEVVAVAQERGHHASARIRESEPSGGSSAVVEMGYWPGERPLGGDHRYQLSFVADGDGSVRLRHERYTPDGTAAGESLDADPAREDDPTKARIQEVALEFMRQAMEDQVE